MRQIADAQAATGGIFVAGKVRCQAGREFGHRAGAGGVAVPVVLLVRIFGEVVALVGEVAVGAGVSA